MNYEQVIESCIQPFISVHYYRNQNHAKKGYKPMQIFGNTKFHFMQFEALRNEEKVNKMVNGE